MKDIITVMKKELTRFLTDKRMLVTLFLPGILIYVMYSFMGGILGDEFSVDEDYTPKIFTVNATSAVTL